MPLEDIYEGGNSKARNPKMQDMLRMIGLGENLGIGFPKILDAWKETNWNAPILEDRLTTEEVRLTLPIPFMEYSEGGINVALNVAYEPTERQRIILNMIKNENIENVALNVALNTKYLSEKIGVNRRTIQRELSILQQRKLIVWIGSKRNGHWELFDKTEG